MQNSKMAVWGGLTNSSEKKKSEGEKERYILFLFSSDEYIFPFLLDIVYYVAIDTLNKAWYWEWAIGTIKT